MRPMSGPSRRTTRSGARWRCRRPGGSWAAAPTGVVVPPDDPEEEGPEGPGLTPPSTASQTPYDDRDASPFQPEKTKPLVNRVFPVTQTLPRYPQRSFQRDLIAGVTVAALALPSGMAYAQLAGVSPIAGLYALLLPVVAYVALGSSRQLIVGPEGALAVMVAAAVGPLAGG